MASGRFGVTARRTKPGGTLGKRSSVRLQKLVASRVQGNRKGGGVGVSVVWGSGCAPVNMAGLGCLAESLRRKPQRRGGLTFSFRVTNQGGRSKGNERPEARAMKKHEGEGNQTVDRGSKVALRSDNVHVEKGTLSARWSTT